MDITTRIVITVNRNSPAIARKGFGVPLIYGYIPTSIIPASERTRVYSASSGLTDMVADGFATTDPIYLAATALLAQTPKPTTFKVGRGDQDFTFAMELTPKTFASGETITVYLSKGGVTRTYTQTAGGVSLNAEATALAAAMNADASGWGTSGSAELTIGVSGAGSGDIVELDAVSPANDNEMWYASSIQNITVEDVSLDRGVATDLAAIYAADSDWYCLILGDAFGAAEIAAAAGWVESNLMIGVYATQDSEVADAGTGIIATLQGLSRDRAMVVYSPHSMAEYPAAAIAGRFLPEEPGEVVWADKSLSGVTSATLTEAQIQNVELRSGDLSYGNHYTLTAGVGNLYPGVVTSGEYMDIIRLTDWTVIRVTEDIFVAHRSNKKIAFTDAGVSLIKGVVLRRLGEKVPDAFVAGSLSFSARKVADISAADKAARKLTNVTFGAQFAGAIMKTDFEANLNY